MFNSRPLLVQVIMPDYAIYLDDSGHPSDKPYVVVAGFLASEDQWIAFETRWKAALGKYRLGEAFHMTDFEASKRTDRGAVLEHLTSVIIENTRSSFSCIVDMAAYKKINDIYALEEAIGTPYALVTRGVARNINIWKKAYLQPGDRVSMFVEHGAKHFGDMEEAFRRDGLQVPQRMPKTNLRVQPGDMLAWEMFHYDAIRPARRSLLNLLKGDLLPDNHGKFLESNILESCRMLEIIRLRKDLPPDTIHVFESSPNRPRKRTIK